MRVNSVKLAVLFAGTLGMCGSAFAECNSSGDTGADLVHGQNGQGNFSCASDLQTSGGTMIDISGTVDVEDGSTKPKSIKWTLVDLSKRVRAVVVEAADGKRCNYYYDGDDLMGDNLTPGGNKPVKNVTFCSDNLPVAESTDPPPAPIATLDGNCPSSGPAGGLQTAVDQSNNVDIVIGIGSFGAGNDPTVRDPLLAVCANNNNSAGGATQVQCTKECVRPVDFNTATGVGPESDACLDALAAGGDPPGTIPLECRACELSPPGAETRFCWEERSSVNLVDEWFRPAQLTHAGRAEWNVIEGSDCYEVTVNFFGVEYTFYSPEGCPMPSDTTP